jgi:hypothetical protein
VGDYLSDDRPARRTVLDGNGLLTGADLAAAQVGTVRSVTGSHP